MNFKKLSLLILAFSIFGTLLQAAEKIITGNTEFFKIKRLCITDIGKEKFWSRSNVHARQSDLPSLFNEQLQSIASLDQEIKKYEHRFSTAARILGSITGLATGFGAYKVLSEANQKNRVLGTLATVATSAGLVYKATRSFLFSIFNKHRNLLNQQLTYLPQRFAQEDLAQQKIQIMTALTLNRPKEQSHWSKNSRALTTFRAMQESIIRADN